MYELIMAALLSILTKNNVFTRIYAQPLEGRVNLHKRNGFNSNYTTFTITTPYRSEIFADRIHK